jgi:hypothetical protein
VPGQERHHLSAGLQDRHIGVEVDPVQALHIQRDMPVEHIVHRHDLLHHATSVRLSQRSREPVKLGSDPTNRPHDRTSLNLGGPRLAVLLLQ